MGRVAVAVLLFAWCSHAFARAGEGRILWEIGKADRDTREFALAPDRYLEYEEDGCFVVGVSDPHRDWPYCHPGSVDYWAGGGARLHIFSVYFGLDRAPKAPCRLVVELADTHPERPPRLRVAVNGRTFEHACPPGGSDASIQGDLSKGKPHAFSLELPPGVLASGLNTVRITNLGPSWVLYDRVALEAEAGVAAAVQAGAWIRSVRLDPWLSRGKEGLGQVLEVELAATGPLDGYALAVQGCGIRALAGRGGLVTRTLRLRPVEAARTVRVELRRDGAVLDGREVTQAPGKVREPVDYVDGLIGTSTSRWMLFPGASMPFGMVKLSPDNQKQGWKAGYEYTIENIAGFSHIHSWTMGGLLVQPATGPLRTVPGPETDPDAGYRSRFRHETETAQPGYYAVTLDDYRIRAELTATPRAGFQRYTFTAAKEARILFDLLTPTEYGYDVLEAKIRKVDDRGIEGWSRQRGGRGARWNEYTVHFVARLSKPFTSMGGWVGEQVLRDAAEITGAGDVGCFLEFATKEGEPVLLQTGISLVSVDQARLNLATETAPFGWDFDACRAHARKTWNTLLGAVEVEGGTERDKVKFYTNLYRSYCARTIWSDVNGKYVDMYEKVRTLPDPASPIIGCDAFWNTFWNLNQLWILLHPEIAEQWVRSLLEIYDKGGWLPKGPTGIEYSSIMVASHEIALITAAYQAGLRGFDAEKAYRAMKEIQTVPGRPHPGGGYVGNRNLEAYMKLGYVPDEDGPVSNTLEYAYDDWCVAQMAKALGKDEDHRYFLERSLNYRNVFDPLVGYVRRRRADGRWVRGFSPFDGHGFVEGNAWQYTFFAPHDVGGLMDLLDRHAFNTRLDAGFTRSRKNRFNATGDRMADYPINHGNQPNMQAAWLFDYTGRPWLTQKWTRAILDAYYGAGPLDGWPGDEDQGQMGAWFVMSAMGLFQMDGGCAVRPVYEVSSPLFDRVLIHLDPRYYQGGTFVIEARNRSEKNLFIQSATLDGKPLERPWFYAEELWDGGSLVLDMGPEPNEAWGSAPGDAPPSVPR